jgi:hypothetical protein
MQCACIYEETIVNKFHIGLMKQQAQLPIQFILEKLWKGASVVLTGSGYSTSIWTNNKILFNSRFFIWRKSGTTVCSTAV